MANFSNVLKNFTYVSAIIALSSASVLGIWLSVKLFSTTGTFGSNGLLANLQRSAISIKVTLEKLNSGGKDGKQNTLSTLINELTVLVKNISSIDLEHLKNFEFFRNMENILTNFSQLSDELKSKFPQEINKISELVDSINKVVKSIDVDVGVWGNKIKINSKTN